MTKKLGLTHIYCGDGKGKTTAAMGIALRGVQNNFNVVIMQFLKNGYSSEVLVLKTFPNVTVFANADLKGFTFTMNEHQTEYAKKVDAENFKQTVALCNTGKCDLLILDEAIGATNYGFLDHDVLVDFIKNRPQNMEVVMTGRNPSQTLIDLADYVSEIKKIKHPYDKGIHARTGIDK
ncbi:MAG: cob(I)yrinic acid a,c-diamide adenosyltransferase [Oscillospiraceae bacterium]